MNKQIKILATAATALFLGTGLVTAAATTSIATAATLAAPKITAVKNQIFDSDFKTLPLYSDANGSTDTGEVLNSNNRYWKVISVAKDSDGNIIAYNLGNNQWIKPDTVISASITAPTTTIINGTVHVNAGTSLYDRNGNVTNKITLTSDYRVFAQTTINNETYYRLGTDSQWVKASDTTDFQLN